MTGASVNLAFRLLDASPLKAALAGSPGVLAVIASSWFFEEVVRHSAVAATYRPVEVSVKETVTTGWICLPDRTDPAAVAMLERLLAGPVVRECRRRFCRLPWGVCRRRCGAVRAFSRSLRSWQDTPTGVFTC